MAGMKFVSPIQRGTMCQWRWPGTPAPAARPRFNPMLNPCGLHHLLQHAHHAGDRLRQLQLQLVAQLVQPGKVPPRGHQQMAVVVRVSVQQRDRVLPPDRRPAAADRPRRARPGKESTRDRPRAASLGDGRAGRRLSRRGCIPAATAPKVVRSTLVRSPRSMEKSFNSTSLTRTAASDKRADRRTSPLRGVLQVGLPRTDETDR